MLLAFLFQSAFERRGQIPEGMFRRSRTFPDAPSRNARAPSRSRARRPSLALWRHRHLVVALCLGAAVVLALSVLRPGQESGREVLVAARTIGAGEVIAAEDLTTRALPPDALQIGRAHV